MPHPRVRSDYMPASGVVKPYNWHMSTGNGPDPTFLPATEADMPFIREAIEREQMDAERLACEQFITVHGIDGIVGFGRVKPYANTHELGSVVVVEGCRGHGLGRAITRELVRRFPQDEVFLTTDLPEYYEQMGFLRTQILPPELVAKMEWVTVGPRNQAVGMVYDRRIERLPTIADVYRAKHLLEPHLPRTPLIWNPTMSRELGFDARLKLENLQPIGAFKVRGGVTLCAGMSEDDRRRGLIAASTGNHGQSIAYGAKLFGIRCVINMPAEANPMKVESMRALGADVQFHGANFEEARAWAEDLAEREGSRYVHHVNTPELIAGVGTMSLEVVEDLPDVDVIVVPIGGGSGAIGHCLVAKALRPSMHVIGVQAAGAPAVYNSWRERTLQAATISTAAEGLATGNAFYIAVKTLIDKLDDMVLVTEEEMRDAVILLARTAHVIAEEAGAAAAAAATQMAERLRGKKVAVIVSGGNVPVDHLRSLLRDG